MTTSTLETGKAYLLQGPNQAAEAFKAAQDSGLTPVYVEVPDISDEDYALDHIYALRASLKSAFTAAPQVAVILDLNNASPRSSLNQVLQQLATGGGAVAQSIVIRDEAGVEKIDTSGVTILLENANPEYLSDKVRTGFKSLDLSR